MEVSERVTAFVGDGSIYSMNALCTGMPSIFFAGARAVPTAAAPFLKYLVLHATNVGHDHRPCDAGHSEHR